MAGESYWDGARWPDVRKAECCWCERTVTMPRMVRMCDSWAEYQCPRCREKFSMQEGSAVTVHLYPGAFEFRSDKSPLPPYDASEEFPDLPVYGEAPHEE